MFTITFDRREVDALLREHAKQGPFAVSTAINETLKKAQADQRAHQRNVLEVRNTRFVDQAVKIKPFATKTALFGVIQVDPPGGAARRDILTKFESGGTKTPKGGRSIAVPEGVKKSAKGVRAGFRPSDLGFAPHGRSGKVFKGASRTLLIRTGRGGMILQRTGKGRVRVSSVRTRKSGYRGRRSGLKLLYILTPSARIGATLKFERTVMHAIGRHAEREMVAAWHRAVKTAR